ncbi:MAG: DUF1059 domain-containing protein [Candidatus Thermoplasmatota archaeon]|jgi:predicted small metal-binding protein|nr:DUF1059 domain-containing protein [Candidatus Thermoplasmatota archaeon]
MTSYQFKCQDIGMDCDFKVSAKKAEDLIPQIADHAKSAHEMTEISDDLKQKVNSAIKKKFF